jgi:inner membrane transporter RhtA
MPAATPPAVRPVTPGSIALLTAGMASIQAGAALASGLFPIIGPAGTTALRLMFGAAMMVAALRAWRARLTLANFRPVLLYGLALGCMNLCFYEALARIPLGIAVALEFTGPLAVAALGSRRWLDGAWVVLAAAGLSLLTPLGGGGRLDPPGMMLALGAGAFWAAYIVTGRLAGAAHGARAAALGGVVAAIAVAPFGIAQAGAALSQPVVLGSALGVALLSTALPYTLEMIVMRRMPARVFGILMSLEPAIAALSGWLFLRQQLSPTQLAAIAAVMAASAGVAVTANRAAADAI